MMSNHRQTQQAEDTEPEAFNNHDDVGNFINLQIPLEAEAGVDSLTFEYKGVEFDVLIPDGSLPGDVLRIHVGRSSDDQLDHDDTKIDLSERGEDPMSTPSSDHNQSKKRSLSDSCCSSMSGKDDNGIFTNNCIKSATGESCFDRSDDDDLENNSSSIPSKERRTVVSLGDKTSMSLYLLESISEKESSECMNDNHNDNIRSGDGTNGMVWTSGTVLAQALTSSIGLDLLTNLFINRQHFKCLELGSGLGVCGIALAHALQPLLSCHKTDTGESEEKATTTTTRATILLTDHGEAAVELLRKNICQNIPLNFCTTSGDDLRDNQGCKNIIHAESLIWEESIPSGSKNQTMKNDDEMCFHLILGSDILYNTHESYDPLANTIKQYLHPDGGIILLAVRWRKPDLEREFFRIMEKRCKGLKFQLWKDFVNDTNFGGKRCRCTLDWKDYGNPDCEASNVYFYETKIRIHRKLPTMSNDVPLAEITEQDMELMTNDEYSEFEEMQVQVYVGRYEHE